MYIPPFKLAQMMAEAADKEGAQVCFGSWGLPCCVSCCECCLHVLGLAAAWHAGARGAAQQRGQQQLPGLCPGMQAHGCAATAGKYATPQLARPDWQGGGLLLLWPAPDTFMLPWRPLHCCSTSA